MNTELPKEKVNAGDVTPVQIAPWGEHPNGDVVQILDEESAARVVGAFDGEILVDADHGSEKGGSSEAYAWIVALRADPEAGLVGDFRWTDVGAEAVNARRYRFVSAAFVIENVGGKRVRPVLLHSCALVNNPAIAAHPILNNAATAAQPENKEPNMDKIKELLGLAPEAGEEEVLAAVKSLQDKIAEAEAAALDAEAEAFAEENKDKVENPEVLRNAYKANKELAKQIVMNCKAPAPAQPAPRVVCNSRAANAAPASSAAVRAEYDKLHGDEKIAYLAAHRAEF